jgi:amidase
LKLDALAYPPLPRKAALVGEPQTGLSTCQLSASTGLPAISMPAGFTPDGVPVGIELLGPDWSEPQLLAMAYAYEQMTHPRRRPPTTPPLVGGKAPAPQSLVATAGPLRTTFTFDPLTGHLTYATVKPAGGDAIVAAALHRAEDGETGPVIVRLMDGMRRWLSGEVVLGNVEREALLNGKLYMSVTTQTGRTLRGPLTPPSK